MKKPAVSALIAFSLLGATLTGCADGAGGGGLDQITVGVLPSIESAPLFLGVEEGFFAEEGIKLNIASFASSGAAMVKPVAEGKYDVAVADLVTLFKASADGNSIQLIAPAGSASGTDDGDFGGLVVPAKSSVESLADLEGKFVGSSSLLDTNNVVLRATMDQGASASWTTQWKEIPFQDAAKALDDGTVDAAFMVEPYLTRAVNDGKRVISYSYTEFDTKLDVSAYFTSSGFAEKNPELYERFTAALEKSIDFAQKHQQKVRAILTTYAKTQWNVRTFFVLPTYTTEFSRPALDKLSASAVKYLVIKEQPDLEAILP